MSDDIFSQLFNLFNNDDGDVNWNLASQINNHINKESEENFLLSNSEMNYEEIFRAIQLNNQSLDVPYKDIDSGSPGNREVPKDKVPNAPLLNLKEATPKSSPSIS